MIKIVRKKRQILHDANFTRFAISISFPFPRAFLILAFRSKKYNSIFRNDLEILGDF